VWSVESESTFRKRHIAPKHLADYGLHGVISQERKLLITTAVRTLNRTNWLDSQTFRFMLIILHRWRFLIEQVACSEDNATTKASSDKTLALYLVSYTYIR
jgi:hypothetical protein